MMLWQALMMVKGFIWGKTRLEVDGLVGSESDVRVRSLTTHHYDGYASVSEDP
jgi:hypothetical protein